MPLIRSTLLAAAAPLLLIACATPPAHMPPSATGAATAPADAPAGSAEATTVQLMEQTRQGARSTAEWLARGVDSWFGDKPFGEGGKVSDGKLSLSLYKRQDEDFKLALRFNARFRLPNLEEKTYFFIGRDNEREIVTDKPGALSRQDRLLGERSDDRSFFAGLGRDLNDAVDFRLGIRGGLKPYAQARYRKPWQLSDRSLLEFRETIFWTVRDHLGSTTALSYEHGFSRTLAARWLNAATITQQNKKFEWSSSLGLYKAFGSQRLLTLEALAGGRQGSGVTVSDYGLQTKWEQPVYRDWILVETQIGHFWPRRDANTPRSQAWAFGTRLKLSF
ncbi:hypothetical protein [Piscinibacter sakaiensis]|uniref:hypothetical protein n=1 Tax=Piscinibacter sakaiensis TaxID=1547922 RepID=UPI003AABE40F